MIRLIEAEKTYDNGTHALNGVSFTVDDGEFVFLVGPSGSGVRSPICAVPSA